MKIVVLSTLLTLGLAGCATPVTSLRNPSSGEVVQCGGGRAGSAVGGLVGYSLQKSDDDDCVNKYKAAGYIPFYPGYEQPPAAKPAPPPKA